MTKKLRYYPKAHTYWYGKQKLTSVTTFVHKFFEPFKAREIARKLAKFPANKKAKRGVRYWLNKWEASAEHGSKVHKELEDWLNKVSCSVSELKSSVGISYIVYLRKMFGEPVLTPELKVFDPELGLAGTIDLLIEHNGYDEECNENNERWLTLVDWKTNEKITLEGYKGKKGLKGACRELDDCHAVKYGLQLATYAYILERRGFKIHKLILAHLTDTECKPLEVDYAFYKPYVEKMIAYEKTTGV